jgi:heterotetrameric sarcosine oxidase gamma subunit
VSLAFLTPPASGEGMVLARSPMEQRARAAGAQFSARDGWDVALRFGDPESELRTARETVGFADRSNMVKLELQGEPDTLAAIVAHVSGGLTIERGLAARSEGTWWCPVTPARMLVLSEPPFGSAVHAAVLEAMAQAPGTTTVADLTCGLAALCLIGPSARELLARFCALDVRPALTPIAGFRPGSVARTPGYVLVEAHDRLLLLVGWALGEYLWEVVADAAEALHGGPLGAEALAQLLTTEAGGADA